MGKTFIYLLLVTIAFNKVNAQGVFLNRVFQDITGTPQFNPVLNPLGFHWSKSIKHSNGHFYTVGYTTIGGQGQNVYLTKYTPDGALIWAMDFNITGASNDYGIGITEAQNGDLLIAGATDNGGATYDAMALRVDATAGSLVGSPFVIDGSGMNDAAISIIEDNSGNIFIAANTESTLGLSDYWLIKCNSSLGFVNSANYDFVGLMDIALGIEITSSGDICLIGASASSASASDFAAAIFNPNTLAFISDERNNIPGTAQDQALAFCKDASGNIYITGKAWNGTNYDIKIFKINANFTSAWSSNLLDVYGLDDVANTIAIDPVTGNVVVGGYATKTNNRKEIIIAYYNSANGAYIKAHKQSSEDNSGDAFLKVIQTNSTGDVYFIGGEKGNSGFNQVLVGKIKSNGIPSWQRVISNTSQSILPSDISVESDGIYCISILDSANKKYIITKYAELELDTTKQNYSNITYKEGELIVRFNPASLKTNVINNSSVNFGRLSDFLTTNAYNSVLAAFDAHNICVGSECDVKAIKIFPSLTTTDTTMVSRMGEVIEMPDLWTALLLKFPNSYGVITVGGVFNSQLSSVAHYAEPNFLAKTFAVPNDSLYGQQHSLHSTATYTNAHVNVQEAWDVVKNGGKPYVRCGVFDTPIAWEHRDFNYNGINPTTSKINDGYNFTFGIPLKSQTGNGDWHGSCVTGIIGAQRNNISGVAGIAGGNDSTASKGISLYGVCVFDPGGSPTISPVFTPLSYISDAIIASAQSATQNPLPYTYRVHLQNHSWGLEEPVTDPGFVNQSITLFKESIHAVNRMKVTAVAARGNNIATTKTYPANCDDDWVLCVSGTGTNGQFGQSTNVTPSPINCEFTSGYGGDIDLGAPCSGSLITSTWGGLGANFQSFGGTSAAAPHVSGAVGLMMTYLNDTTGADNYNNMAPEDCEAILQLTATDTDSSGYDQLTGYGRLNIGRALKKIQKPYHQLRHFGTHSPFSYSISKSLNSVSDVVTNIERFQINPLNGPFTQAGQYKVKTFKITSTVNHNIGALDTIIAFWPRPSSTVTWNKFVNIGGTNFLTPRQKTKIISCNNSTAVLEGYIFQVTDMSNNPLGWWPVDTAYIQATLKGYWAEYSVLTRNLAGTTGTGLNEKLNNSQSIQVFPNPTNGSQTIQVVTNKVSNLTVELFDITGRKIKTVFSGKSNEQNTVINHDVSGLTASLYLYVINIDGITTSKKLIKE